MFLSVTMFVHIIFDAVIEHWYGIKSIYVNTIIFNITPESLNVNVVDCASYAVHTYLYVVVFQHFSKGIRRKLATPEGFRDRLWSLLKMVGFG